MIENTRTETLDFAFREAMKKEAIAFKDWCDNNADDIFGKNYTNEQLYDIFNCSVKANNDKNHTTKTD